MSYILVDFGHRFADNDKHGVTILRDIMGIKCIFSQQSKTADPVCVPYICLVRALQKAAWQRVLYPRETEAPTNHS